MSHGYGIPFHKRATQDNFDGSATAKTLWLKGSAIYSIDLSAGFNTDETAVARIYLLGVLEYFSGATWTGAAWSGGAWTELWAGHMSLYCGATATKDSTSTGQWQKTFEAPMIVPAPFNVSIQKPPGSPRAGVFEFPNTHAAAEVATETDLRFYVTSLGGNATAAHVDISATLNVME
jgi:hypothetical protein